MKRVYYLEGLECAHCASKLGEQISKMAGVTSAICSLIDKRLVIDSEEGFDGSTSAIQAIVDSIETGVTVSLQKKEQQNSDQKIELFRLIIGAILFGVGFFIPIKLLGFALCFAVLGCKVLWKAFRNALKLNFFDENFLMSVASIGAFVIGEYAEACAVLLFYGVGEFFQALAVARSRRSIEALLDIKADSATVLKDGNLRVVSPDMVNVGEIVVIKPGERVPLDGVVVSGESYLDTSALTGESVQRSARIGDSVLAGCVNVSGVIEARVTKPYTQSTAAKIIDLVQNASSRKARSENFITKFCRYYTPIVVLSAIALAFLPPLILQEALVEWVHRALIFLVISCPCALVLSVPLSYFGGIGAASRLGILIKGSNYLDALASVDTVVFDKTGTLTEGVFEVQSIIPVGVSEDYLLETAARAEAFSTHPIAQSIMRAYGKQIQADRTDYTEIAGYGIQSGDILVGGRRLMERFDVDVGEVLDGGGRVFVAEKGVFIGIIIIADKIRDDSKTLISNLKLLGVRTTAILSGDNREVVMEVAKQIGVDKAFYELLPDQKVESLSIIKGRMTAYVGDGINDAPVLASADIGIAMGGLGSDAAVEAADVVLLTDEPSKIASAVRIARRTRRIVIENIVLALGVKALFLVLGAVGLSTMWEAVFADVGVSLIAVLNAMRALKAPRK